MKLISLSGKRGAGLFAKVSDVDYEYLSQWKWYLHSGGYAVRYLKPAKIRLMHRDVADRAGMTTQYGYDHKDHDRLDNQRDSIRPATRAQNAANSTARRRSGQRLKGVYHRKDTGRFNAQITVNGKKRGLGDYDTEQEANAAYTVAAKIAFGEFARSK